MAKTSTMVEGTLYPRFPQASHEKVISGEPDTGQGSKSARPDRSLRGVTW